MTQRDATTNLAVCADCETYLANGEVWEVDGEGGRENVTEAHAALIAAVWGDEVDLALGSVDGDDEPWFSWARCDGCGNKLAGDRVRATAWVTA